MAKQHLIEHFKVSGNVVKKIQLTESNQIIESNGQSYKCRAAYELPVWRLDKENLNERIYGSDLAESLVKEGKVTSGLVNHPDKEVDVGKTFCVERNPHIRDGRNPHIRDGVMFVDAYFVGDGGQLAKEILEAGGEIGLSSSAYGDVQEKKVILEGFEIERYADWVDSPSYEVFVNGENAIEQPEAKKKEEVEDTDATSQLNEKEPTNITTITQDTQEDKESKTMSEEKKLSIEEKNLKIGVSHLFKEAEATESPRDKLKILEEILEYCDSLEFATEYTEKAQTQIDEINENLHKLAEKAKEQEEEMKTLQEGKETSEKSVEDLNTEVAEYKKTNEELSEKYDVALALLDNLKEREKTLTELYAVALAEKNGMVTASEYKELQIYVETIEEDIQDLKEANLRYKKEARKAITDEIDTELNEDEEDTDLEEDDETDETSEIEEEVEDDGDYHFINDNVDVQNYYEDLLEQNPNVAKIEKDILSKNTLMEAQRTYLNLKDLVEDIPSPFKKRMSEMLEETKDGTRKKVVQANNFGSLIREGWD